MNPAARLLLSIRLLALLSKVFDNKPAFKRYFINSVYKK